VPSTVHPAAASITTTLRRGSTGVTVRVVQQLMNYGIRCRSLPVEPLVVDGIYGVRTEGAVRAFQQQHDMLVDGIVGPATWQLLQRNLTRVMQQGIC
jgi:peptidoglycan hydrolase-like protein with peptidoglycan-binding domain